MLERLGMIMKRFKKVSAVIICLIAVCIAVVPLSVMASSQFGDWEQFYSFNKSIMQRHAHTRQLMKVPIYRQSKNYTSGVACVQSVLRYAKYELDIREDNLARALNATEEHGVKADKIAQYLNAVRLDEKEEPCFKAELRKNMTLDELKKELAKGHPVICAIQAWDWDENEEYTMELDYSGEWECGHWVLAIGYNDDNVFFMDPSTAGNYTYIPNKKLMERWHDYNVDENNQRYDLIQWGIVIELCGDQEPDGERYQDAFFGLM